MLSKRNQTKKELYLWEVKKKKVELNVEINKSCGIGLYSVGGREEGREVVVAEGKST